MKCGRGKSAGMDEVPPFLWYILPDDIFKHLCDIIRVVLKGSYYPSVFKDSRVFPLYKKGDPLRSVEAYFHHQRVISYCIRAHVSTTI